MGNASVIHTICINYAWRYSLGKPRGRPRRPQGSHSMDRVGTRKSESVCAWSLMLRDGSAADHVRNVQAVAGHDDWTELAMGGGGQDVAVEGDPKSVLEDLTGEAEIKFRRV